MIIWVTRDRAWAKMAKTFKKVSFLSMRLRAKPRKTQKITMAGMVPCARALKMLAWDIKVEKVYFFGGNDVGLTEKGGGLHQGKGQGKDEDNEQTHSPQEQDEREALVE